jgi:poly(hydroxyalkanoate) depolymerase family esterase
MNPFLRKILAATGLTRQGNLVDATNVIQRALADALQASTHSEDGAPGSTSSVAARAPSSVVELDERRAATPLVEPAPAEEIVDEAPVLPPEDEGLFVSSSFTAAAGTRGFKLFVPGGFGTTPLPLVVMLHGCTQNPDDFAAGTRMNVLAQEQGFLVLYPAQAPRSNAHKCWNWFQPRDQRRGTGEPALLAGMTRHIQQTQSIDRDRVYVAGLSAGGAMAAILAHEYPDLFAAAGVHSGVAPGAAHDVVSAFSVMKTGAGPVPLHPGTGAPVIVFHGDADATVVAANGDAVIGAVLGLGAQATATTTESPEGNGARAFRRTVWRRADGAEQAPSLAEQWVVCGAGHAWSGGAAAGSYSDPVGPDASREMLRFFREHPLRRC